jgi:hypothetical protein
MDYPKVGKLEGKLIALTGVNYWGVVGQSAVLFSGGGVWWSNRGGSFFCRILRERS